MMDGTPTGHFHCALFYMDPSVQSHPLPSCRRLPIPPPHNVYLLSFLYPRALRDIRSHLGFGSYPASFCSDGSAVAVTVCEHKRGAGISRFPLFFLV